MNSAIRLLSQSVVKYTQGQLWEAEGQPDSVVVGEKGHDEVMPISWINGIANALNGRSRDEYKVTVNESVPGGGHLNSWLESCNMRGNGCFLYMDILKRGDCRLPALWTKTESADDFSSSINMAARGVIAQLRCL